MLDEDGVVDDAWVVELLIYISIYLFNLWVRIYLYIYILIH